MASLDSFKCRKKLTVGAKTYHYFSLKAAEKNGLKGISNLPVSMKVLLENLLRFEDGRSVTKEDIKGVAEWLVNKGKKEREIAFRPSRVLMQDFTGVPAVVDLAAMRAAGKERPIRTNPPPPGANAGVKIRRATAAKLRELMPGLPAFRSLDEGMRLTIEWYRDALR